MFSSIPKPPFRQNMTDKFSMYMTVENNNGRSHIQWKSEPRLKRNIELYKSRHQQFASLCAFQDNGKRLVQFWINMALNDLPPQEEWEPKNRVQMAWEHLTLYFEESCYWSALLVWKEDKFKCWESYIFFARCLIYDLDKFRKILSKYNPANSSIDTYVTEILKKTIKDEAAVAKFSKWRLLCRKSDKELREALQRDAHCESGISRFLFARKYFKQVYQMNKIHSAKRTGQKWADPDSADFAEAATYYNSEKLLPSAPHEVYASANITDKQLKAWMEICIAALQNYPKSITPRFSIEALLEVGHEIASEDNPEVVELDSLIYHEAEYSAENQENLGYKTKVALQQQLLSLKPEQQKILLLYYGLGLNQTQIADKFAVTQVAINSRLKTIQTKLLKTLCELSQPPKWVTQYVAGWLDCNYQTPIYSDLIHVALVEAVKKLDRQEQDVLRLEYGQKLSSQIIANQLGITIPEFPDILRKAKSKLEAALIKEIESMINKYLRIYLPKLCQAVVKSAFQNLGHVPSEAAVSLEIENTVLEECLKIWHLSQ